MDSSSAPSDAELLDRIAQQDSSALSKLYDRYASLIYRVAFKTLQSVEESEEVVLDVFGQVWRIATRYDSNKGKAETWLLILVRSRILDRLRKLQRIRPSPEKLMNLHEIQTQTQSVDPIEVAVLREKRDRILAALSTLSDEQRRVIELAYYQGLTHSQIAAETGLPIGTVKTRIRLGLGKLKTALNAGSSESL